MRLSLFLNGFTVIFLQENEMFTIKSIWLKICGQLSRWKYKKLAKDLAAKPDYVKELKSSFRRVNMLK